MDNLDKMEEKLRGWAAEVIVQVEGQRPGTAGHAAIILSEANNISRMKGGVNTLAMALLALQPADRMTVISKIVDVSPGLFNRIMRELSGQVGRASRHDLIATLLIHSRHLVLSDILSSDRAQRVALAIEYARFQQ